MSAPEPLVASHIGPIYQVAVRELCEFTAKQGDLDVRFTPAPSASEGMAGHTTVAGRRPNGYEREITLTGQYGPLHLRGRADGYDAARNQLEEIKTHRGDLSRQPENHRHLHWAQARIYGWLLCQQRGLEELNVALVYFDIVSQKETVLSERHSAAALEAFFNEQCAAFLAWAEQELVHRRTRDAALAQLSFAHAQFRPGQRDLAEAVFKAASTGRCLLAQAPTGIGKTLGTLFPLLKACAAQGLDKVFYLAARTPGRQLALDAMYTLKAQPVRTLELVARDKACVYPDRACHGGSCPLAQGFYDRLPAARAHALQPGLKEAGSLTQARIQQVAAAHEICPYYLSQELTRWADVVVGDYNYFFDSSALLYALTQRNQWQVGVLVDEAHNLVERGRGMYSASLDQATLKDVRKHAPAPLKRSLTRVANAWRKTLPETAAPYTELGDPPSTLTSALQEAIAAITEYLTGAEQGADSTLQRFYFDALRFTALADSFSEHSLFDATQDGRNSSLNLRNVVPAPFLRTRFAAARSVTLFSATLSPHHYFSGLLGLPDNHVWLDVPAPFSPDQVDVRIAPHISTRYTHRAASVAPIVQLIGEQYARQPGNYLAFFSSFEYLQQVADAFDVGQPDIPYWRQDRGMDEASRTRFIDRFEDGGRGVGFAVLGGVFGEGIDLPGDRLIGAFVATLGLPQVNAINEQIRQRMHVLFGAGYDYAYTWPGMQKVVQAAGRVIRTPHDKGTIHLIDDRFGRAEIQALFPSWWPAPR
ncbi:ATP-dependent DNA helicase [Amantichitinum ursilacus]|uniref:Bifunctional ATP-dependent DNA helicase/DNA polymerase III subunit epsilon n=1 Tax=Amantichitinum ursilacus TaxID=857265 RepID=A0A0N0XFT4_9NEIS|nr:ATP-dependent DNA helicase [Amantichitinum ursilacus]KPC49339.1 bifunctional ATP-dependent DNA helicase/DNA polymerase III subunit epsilon [Amantichitinum ursilacus]